MRRQLKLRIIESNKAQFALLGANEQQEVDSHRKTNEHRQAVSDLQAQNEVLTTELAAAATQREGYDIAIYKLRVQLSNAEVQHLGCDNTMKRLRKDLAALIEENTKLHSEVEAARNQQANCDEDARRLGDEKLGGWWRSSRRRRGMLTSSTRLIQNVMSMRRDFKSEKSAFDAESKRTQSDNECSRLLEERADLQHQLEQVVAANGSPSDTRNKLQKKVSCALRVRSFSWVKNSILGSPSSMPSPGITNHWMTNT